VTTPGVGVTEGQPADKQGAQDTQNPQNPQNTQAAESYDGVAPPEGFEDDPALMGEARALFGELKLTSEQAQALVNFAAKKGLTGGMVNEQELWQKQVDDWTNQIKADSEVGGLKLSESLGLARKGVDRLGGKELMDALDHTGAGVHPAVFKAFVKLGKMLSEDRFVTGPAAPAAGGSRTPQDMARQVYGRIM
jgi:hypothetical protein